VIVVDDDIDARDRKDVMWAISMRIDQTVIGEVTRKWSSLGLPGTGKPIWK
jgi:UbiD family decarboxylase